MNGTIDSLRPHDDGNGGIGYVKTDGGEKYWFRYFANDRLSREQIVTFDTRTSRKDPTKLDAYNVRPVGSVAPSPREQHNAPPAQADMNAYHLPADTSKLLFSSAGVQIQNTALEVEKYIRKADKLKIKYDKEFSEDEKKVLREVYLYQQKSQSHLGVGITIVGTGYSDRKRTAIASHPDSVRIASGQLIR